MILTLRQSIRSNILNVDKPYFMLLNEHKIRKTKSNIKKNDELFYWNGRWLLFN